MPLPLVLIPLVPWITGVVSTLTAAGVGTIAYSEVKRKFNDIGPAAIQASLEKMGIDIDASGGINDESLTAAINGTFLQGSDVQLASIFDRDKLKKGLAKVALKKAADAFGLPGVTSEAGLRAGVSTWLTGEVIAQLQSEGGAVFDAAKESARVKRVLVESVKVVGWNTPTDFSKEGIANRARQAKYRHRHKKTWIKRSEK